jgi:hypothetical protein
MCIAYALRQCSIAPSLKALVVCAGTAVTAFCAYALLQLHAGALAENEALQAALSKLQETFSNRNSVLSHNAATNGASTATAAINSSGSSKQHATACRDVAHSSGKRCSICSHADASAASTHVHSSSSGSSSSSKLKQQSSSTSLTADLELLQLPVHKAANTAAAVQQASDASTVDSSNNAAAAGDKSRKGRAAGR